MNFNDVGTRFQNYLLENFWLMPVLLSIVTFLSEYIDHHHEGSLMQNREFLREVIIFSVLFPIILGVIVYYLKKVYQERATLTSEMDSIFELGRKLSSAENWDDLLLPVSDYFQTSVPLKRIYLSVFDPVQKDFKIVSNWSKDFPIDDTLTPDISVLSKNTSIDSNTPQLAEPRSYRIAQINSLDDGALRYYLPLPINEFIFSIVVFDISSSKPISQEQNMAISTIIPELIMAVAYVYSKEFSIDQNHSMQKERQRIARVLHDTLAQDISYLRMKLDLLREQDSLIGILEVQRDLERMQTVAQNAYDQVRGTLDSLVPETPKNISQSMLILAHAICDPSDIKVEFSVVGETKPLPTETTKKILNISREAISNVVKHSGASEVKINILWNQHQVTFEIEDRGKGFTPEECIKVQHYGMIFMRERAESINADLKISSKPDHGTKIILTLPLVEIIPAAH